MRWQMETSCLAAIFFDADPSYVNIPVITLSGDGLKHCNDMQLNRCSRSQSLPKDFNLVNNQGISFETDTRQLFLASSSNPITFVALNVDNVTVTVFNGTISNSSLSGSGVYLLYVDRLIARPNPDPIAYVILVNPRTVPYVAATSVVRSGMCCLCLPFRMEPYSTTHPSSP